MKRKSKFIFVFVYLYQYRHVVANGSSIGFLQIMRTLCANKHRNAKEDEIKSCYYRCRKGTRLFSLLVVVGGK